MADEVRTQRLSEIWEGDALDRRQDAEILRNFTLGHLTLRANAGEPRTYVLNLDARWGAGKSFFLNRLKKHLEAYGHVAVYVNAWEDDHSEDPFMTVVDEIQTELARYVAKKSDLETASSKLVSVNQTAVKIIGGALYSGGKHLLTKYVGEEAVSGVGQLLHSDGNDVEGESSDSEKALGGAIQKAVENAVDEAGEEMMAQFRHQKKVKTLFRDEMADLAAEILEQDAIESPIFVLIDELDRCRPSYAIELLERVKHIFSLENFVFVLGTDTQQLANAIKGVYGAEFDGERYLRRFVDRTYHFQQPSKDKLVFFAMERNGLKDEMFRVFDGFSATTFLSKCFGEAKTDARDLEQIVEVLGTFTAANLKRLVKIDLVTLLPLIYQKHFNRSDWQFRDSDLAGVEFSFSERSAQTREGRKEVKLRYGSVWDDLSRCDSAYFEGAKVRNSFEAWLQRKIYAEFDVHRSVTGLVDPPEHTRDQYQRLMGLLLHFESFTDTD